MFDSAKSEFDALVERGEVPAAALRIIEALKQRISALQKEILFRVLASTIGDDDEEEFEDADEGGESSDEGGESSDEDAPAGEDEDVTLTAEGLHATR